MGSPAPLATLKEMHLETPLVANGQPQCTLAVPNAEGYAELAALLNARIRQRTGVELPIVPADTVDEAALRQRHYIALGHLSVSRPIALLQCLGQIRVDGGWPEESGFLVRSVHNPLGAGFNVIVLGGSRLEGVRKAVEHFTAALAGEQVTSLSVGFLHSVETPAKRPAPPTDEAIAESVRALQGRSFGAIAGAVTRAAEAARTWGDAAFVRQFMALMKVFAETVQQMDAVDDLRSCTELPLLWDCIEEHPALTDADRLWITNVFLEYAHKCPYGDKLLYGEVQPSPSPHGNNWNAEGSASVGRYFERYYPNLEIGRRIMERLRTYYASDIPHWKPAEDCPGYGDITVGETMRWALRSLDFTWFHNGNARKIANYDILIVNNLGYASGFGDYSGLGRKYATSVWPVVAWYERDGRYLWMYQKCGGGKAEFWCDDIEPKEPVDLLGVKQMELPEWVYRREANRPFPRERGFDKISFRKSFDPQDEYLCLSGFSYGFHSHPDGNAVVNLTARGRVWLFDDGYMVPEMNEHNTVTVVYEGRSAALPELVELAGKADLPDMGLTKTVVSDYCHTRWARHILWRKGAYFLFFDEVAAQQAGEFGLQCIWRTLGERRLEAPRYTVTQDGEAFHIVNAEGASLSLKDCRRGPSHSKALYQSWSGTLRRGASHIFINALYATEATAERHLEIEAIAPNAAVVRTEKEIALAGIGSLIGPNGVRARADLVFRSPEQWRFLNATDLSGAGPTLKATAPVSGWLNLDTGEGAIQAEREAQVTLQTAASSQVRVGTRELRADSQGRVRFSVAAGQEAVIHFPRVAEAPIRAFEQALRTTFEQQAAGSRQAREKAAAKAPRHVRPLWSFQREGEPAPWRITRLAACDLDGDGTEEIVVGGSDGTVCALGADGTPRWRVRLGGVVHALDAADLDGDGRGEVVAGCGDKKLYVLNADGSERWSLAPPPRSYERPGYRGVEPFQGAILVSFTADINGDGKREILVGSANWWTYCYDAAGTLLWSTVNWAHNPTCGVVADLDGDGKMEVLMGNDYASAAIYRQDGTLLTHLGMTWHAGPTAIDAADRNGDGRAEVVCGDLGGRVTFYAHPDKKESHELGTCITAVRVANLKGAQTRQAVVASRNNYLYAFDEQGKPLWHRHMGDVPADVAVADLDGDGRDEIVAACEDGWVRVLRSDGQEMGAWHVGEAAGPLTLVRRKEGGFLLAVASADGQVHAAEGTFPRR